MSIELWLAFVAASAILLVIPGPTILTVIGYSLTHGRRANAALVAAVALGDSTALVLSLLGLGALLATSAFWFTVVKWVGGLYLLFLGIRLFRSGVAVSESRVDIVLLQFCLYSMGPVVHERDSRGRWKATVQFRHGLLPQVCRRAALQKQVKTRGLLDLLHRVDRTL